VERILDTYYPEFLRVEKAGASQAPGTYERTDSVKPV